MKQKIIKFTLLAVIIALSILLFISMHEKPRIMDSLTIPYIENNSHLPIRLQIPEIHIDANIESVGLTALGAMEVPKTPGVGWFDVGVQPGEMGNAVIAGHTGWKDNIPAVFDKLGTLKKGDKIFVLNSNGEVVTFVVREIKSYDAGADSSEVFGSMDGKSHLNLITCSGVWNKISKSSSKRLVVFTDKM